MTESDYDKAVQAGLGDFVRRIHGDRVDDTYEGSWEAVVAAKQLLAQHNNAAALLKRSAVARKAVLDAYYSSPRNSDGVGVILQTALQQYDAWTMTEKLIAMEPSAAAAALLAEHCKL